MPNHLNKAETLAASQIAALLEQFSPARARAILAKVSAAAEDDAPPPFARSVAGPLGKLDTPLKTWLDAGTADLFRRKAAMRKQDASSALRDCAYAWVHQKTYTVMAAEKALHDADAMDVLAHMTGPFEGRESGGPDQ